jgi:hypothetical protein
VQRVELGLHELRKKGWICVEIPEEHFSGADPKDRHRPRRNEMKFDLRGHLYRIFGVDLTEVPGLNALTAHTLLTEVGSDLSAFPNVGAFAS